jgi:hypothetical protein
MYNGSNPLQDFSFQALTGEKGCSVPIVSQTKENQVEPR